MRPNKVKQLLREGKAAIGTIFSLPSPMVVELVAHMGFDFALLDGEHGSIDELMCEDLVRAAEATALGTVVRVPRNERATIARFLETGAQGVMVPWVNTAAEAKAAVDAVRYHPLGQRGLGPGRASQYGLAPNMGDYAREANEQNLLVIQIEDIQAVHNLDAILAVPGIDVVMIGPSDLSKSMGLAGRADDPRVGAVIDEISEKTLAARLTLGMIASNASIAREEIARGARFVICGLTRIIIGAGREFVQGVKKE
jgi:2-keto-3-deoxy-L-rhamnonate aldolase RhmA